MSEWAESLPPRARDMVEVLELQVLSTEPVEDPTEARLLVAFGGQAHAHLQFLLLMDLVPERLVPAVRTMLTAAPASVQSISAQMLRAAPTTAEEEGGVS